MRLTTRVAIVQTLAKSRVMAELIRRSTSFGSKVEQHAAKGAPANKRQKFGNARSVWGEQIDRPEGTVSN